MRSLVPILCFWCAACNTVRPQLSRPPGLPDPPPVMRQDWLHARSALVQRMGSPHHLVEDAIVADGQTASLGGKFDYGSLVHTDLEDEVVEVWLHDPATGWESLGEHRTDGDGRIEVACPVKPVGRYAVRMVVAGDLSDAWGWMFVVEPGRTAVVFDLDGTITTDDGELVEFVLGFDTVDLHPGVLDLLHFYAEEGHLLVYLTARPYWLVDRSRAWMRESGLPLGCLMASQSALASISQDKTRHFKRDRLQHLIEEVGLRILAAYGNATSDIDAYLVAGLPPEWVFIIGEHAGEQGTRAIAPDYREHVLKVGKLRASSGNRTRSP